MSKQINQYTKTRTSGTVTDDDYLDLDSTEDSGSTFESAKMTMLNFVNYLKTKILSFYTNNGTLTGERLVTMASNDAIFHDGNIYVKSELSDNGFLLRDSSDVLKGGMTYDVSAASAGLALINSGGVYFEAIDGDLIINTDDFVVVSAGVGIGIAAPTSRFYVKGIGSGIGTSHFQCRTSTNGLTFFGRDDGFVGLKASSPVGSEVIRLNGNTLIGDAVSNTIINPNGIFITSFGGTNTKNFSVSNNADGEYFTVTSDAGEGRIGINAEVPDLSAALEIESTTMGFLQTRMTTTQRNAISTPPEGLQVYNLTTSKMNFYNGSTWEEITSS